MTGPARTQLIAGSGPARPQLTAGSGPARPQLTAETGPSRRQVLRGGCAAGAAGLVAGCGGSDALEVTPEPDGSIRVPVSDIEVGGSTYVRGAQIVVVQPTEGDYRAYDGVCPHQGCQVSETGSEGELVCPCHNSRFDPTTGEVVSGPATTGLTTLTVSTDGSDLVIRG